MVDEPDRRHGRVCGGPRIALSSRDRRPARATDGIAQPCRCRRASRAPRSARSATRSAPVTPSRPRLRSRRLGRRRETALSDHSGLDGLAALLRRSEILVTLPATPATEAARCRQLGFAAATADRQSRRGSLVEGCRPSFAALDGGQIGRTTLDVFRAGLPPDHHTGRIPVTVTPYRRRDPLTPRAQIAANLKQGRDRPALPQHSVDRAHGC